MMITLLQRLANATNAVLQELQGGLVVAGGLTELGLLDTDLDGVAIE